MNTTDEKTLFNEMQSLFDEVKATFKKNKHARIASIKKIISKNIKSNVGLGHESSKIYKLDFRGPVGFGATTQDIRKIDDEIDEAIPAILEWLTDQGFTVQSFKKDERGSRVGAKIEEAKFFIVSGWAE